MQWVTVDKVRKKSDSEPFVKNTPSSWARAALRCLRADCGTEEAAPHAELIMVRSMPMWYKKS